MLKKAVVFYSFAGLCSLLFLPGCKPATALVSFNVENPSDISREAALVVLKRAEIQRKSNRKVNGYFKVMLHQEPVICQFDDLDKDGQWDELAFLHDFRSGEKISVQLYEAGVPGNSEVKPRAHVRHKRKLEGAVFGPSLVKDSIDGSQQPTDFARQALPPFLTEGPAWENDQLGFRLYFDCRNGKDIWGKLTREMILDKVGTDTTQNYHKLAAWGMDLLKVGGSLGAGALALYMPELEGKDSLVRVGGSNIKQTSYEQIADGPVRAIFRMHYKDWNLHPSLLPLSVTEEIHIWGGQLFYESYLSVTNMPDQAQFVTGIVNLHNADKHELYEGTAAAVYTHARQSENNDALGMAILLSKKDLAGFSVSKNDATDIRNTYLVKMNRYAGQQQCFRFYAAWEKSQPSLAKTTDFEHYLVNQLKQFQQPLIVR